MNSKKILQAYKLKPEIVNLIMKYAKKYHTSKTYIVECALVDFFKNKNEDVL